MSAVSHNKTLTMADFTGTVTVFNSQASTTTIAATDIWRPSNVNSAHDQYITISGNTSGLANAGPVSNIILAGGSNITLSMTKGANVASISIVASGVIMSRYTDFGVPGAISSSGVTAVSASLRVIGIDQPITFTNIAVPMLWTLSTTANASTFGRAITSGLVIYTNNASTLSPVVGAVGTTTITWASNSSNWSQNNGDRLLSFNIASVLQPGEYFMALQFLTATTTSSGSATFSIMFRSDFTGQNFLDMGVNSTAVTTNAYFMGLYSSTISASGQTLAMTDFTISNTQQARANFPILFRAI
jgi:hypothetical protein